MSEIESEREFDELRRVGAGLIYNDFSGLGASGSHYNLLHASWCRWLTRANLNVRKLFFPNLDEATVWLNDRRGAENEAWRRCGSCRAGDAAVRANSRPSPRAQPRSNAEEMATTDAPPTAVTRGISGKLTELFVQGELDLSARPGAPSPGWSGMPEVAAAERLRKLSASDADVRRFLTFTAAMDRARDADALWEASRQLFERSPELYEPEHVERCELDELLRLLREGKVSQRHTLDAEAWKRIGTSLARRVAPPVNEAIVRGVGTVTELRTALRQVAGGQPAFPFLRGPKVSLMWIRMLAYPGGATIGDLEDLRVAVDVQVRKVSDYLGVTATQGRALDSRVRAEIQTAWAEEVRAYGAAGPAGLEGTGAALDPALWFYGKWGCTRCERTGRRIPISTLCAGCHFDRRTT